MRDGINLECLVQLQNLLAQLLKIVRLETPCSQKSTLFSITIRGFSPNRPTHLTHVRFRFCVTALRDIKRSSSANLSSFDFLLKSSVFYPAAEHISEIVTIHIKLSLAPKRNCNIIKKITKMSQKSYIYWNFCKEKYYETTSAFLQATNSNGYQKKSPSLFGV